MIFYLSLGSQITAIMLGPRLRPFMLAIELFFLQTNAFEPPCQKPSKMFMLRSGKVESVKVHDFVPYRYKVVQEFPLGVLTSVDFRQGPELGVRAED